MQLKSTLGRLQDINQKDFFQAGSQDTFEKQLNVVIKYISNFLDRDFVHSGKSPAYLKHLVDINKTETYEPKDLHLTMEELKSVFMDHTVGYHHPNYLSHLNCPVALPSILGDLVASSLNTAIETWDQSTSGTLIEQEMIDWICNRMGLTSSSDGIFTSGGSQSNLLGMILARDHFAYENYGINIKENGVDHRISKFKILCSEKSHFSLKKSAAILGMGYDAVIPIATDHRMKMQPDALEKTIQACIKNGDIPIAVVATLGTTDYGSFDPLIDISYLAQKYNLWLHVDGAYGGCFALTETHKNYFNGIASADSVTIDFHKTYYQTVCSSALLVNEKEHFKYVAHHADYLNPIDHRNDEMPNLIEKSIQTTRRFDALKLWFTLKMFGEKKMASFLEEIHLITIATYDKVKKRKEFEFIHEPELTTIVFRYLTPNVTSEAIHERVNLYIKNELYNAGEVSIASTRHEGHFYLKLPILDPNLTSGYLISIFDVIKSKGEEYQIKN